MAREAVPSVWMILIVLLIAIPASAGLGVASTTSPFAKVLYPVFHPGQSSPAAATASDNLIYHGGAVEHAPKVYLVFWEWHGIDPNNVAPYLTNFVAGMGGTDWAKVQTQYYDNANGQITNPTGQLAGVWYDDATPDQGGLAPVATTLGVVLGQEALRAEAHFGGYDPNAQYIIATPFYLNDPAFGVEYCAWHSTAQDAQGNLVAYTNLPYIPNAGSSCGQNFVNSGSQGTLDGVSIVAGHEYAETVTDTHPASGWIDANGQENGDKCAWNSGRGAPAQDLTFSTGTFAVQSLWSNADDACAVNYVPTTGLVPCFSVTRTNLTVSVDASCSRDPAATIDSWSWNWGDGSAASTGSTASHTYAAGGAYTITLTEGDDMGSTGTTSTPVTARVPHVDTYTGTILVGTEGDLTHLGCGTGHTVSACAPGMNGTNAEQVFFNQDEGGTSFTLKGALLQVNTGSIEGTMGAPDFDIGFVTCSGTELPIIGSATDEHGTTPANVCSAWVYLDAGAAATFTLTFQ